MVPVGEKRLAQVEPLLGFGVGVGVGVAGKRVGV